MSKIKILDDLTCSKIAAGEVIERPYSIVKELVENSIDAGATKIDVRISNDAKNIRVIDNGCGVEMDEVAFLFYPHATSKINSADDIFGVETLGFRGEALASIAAVSMVSAITKTDDEDIATKIDLRGGAMLSIEQIQSCTGFDINITNLFYNTPVREKFLKKPASEEAEIKNLLNKFILSNPYIQFILYINEELAIKSHGKGLAEAIKDVYGNEPLENCHCISHVSNGIIVNGYISKIGYTKFNKSRQLLILNGRIIQNNTISMAISKAYSPYLMTRCFPFYVLHIDVDAQTIDVNVHPTKFDVRFEDNDIVFRTIFKLVSGVLEGNIDYTKAIQTTDFDKQLADLRELNKNIPQFVDKPYNIRALEKSIEQSSIDNSAVAFNHTIKQIPLSSNDMRMVNPLYFDNKINTSKRHDFLEDSVKQFSRHLENFKLIGTLFSTYILGSLGDSFILIDQHAGHERIIYDEYLTLFAKEQIASQELIMPILYQTTPQGMILLRKLSNTLLSIGIDIKSNNGTSFEIIAVPQNLKEIDVLGFFNELLETANSFTPVIDSIDLCRKQLISRACHFALKGNCELSMMEIYTLLDMIDGGENLICPHGRPIIVKIDKKEVEKWFKRIV